MDSALVKSLKSLIDETLQELDDLKKSRFSASEIKLDGPGSDGIAGKPANGHLGKDEDEKDDEEDEDKDMDKGEDCSDDMDKKEDEDDKEDEDKDDMDKAEGKNSSADPGPVHHGEGKDKGAGPREQSGGGKMRPASGTNSKADMGEIHKDEGPEMKKPKMAKKEDKKDKDEDDKMEWKMKKSQNEMTSLMKSFVDERIKPLEDKLSTIADLVNKVLDQPVAPRGFTARGAVPLAKSAEEFGETLSKSQVSSKLWELKKSGTPVDSLDVTKAEMGQELDSIVKKYKIS